MLLSLAGITDIRGEWQETHRTGCVVIEGVNKGYVAYIMKAL